METNLVPTGELKKKAEKLLTAAYDFWKAHQRLGGPRAVVWLRSDEGHLVVFTRGEYFDTITRNIRPLTEEIPLGEVEDWE